MDTSFNSFLKQVSQVPGYKAPEAVAADKTARLKEYIAGPEAEYKKKLDEAGTRYAELSKKMGDMKPPEDPALKDIPDAPNQQYADPLQGLAGVGTLLAVIGSLRTRAPLTSMLNSMAASIQGFHEGDKQKGELEQKNWQNHFKQAMEQNNVELQKYKTALEKSNFDFHKAQNELQTIAIESKNDAAKAALEAGDFEKFNQITDGMASAQASGIKNWMTWQQKEEMRADRQQRAQETAQYHRDLLAARTAPVPPVSPETVDYYASQSLAGDNSWQVGLARGKVGQALIQAVKDRIPQMAKERNMSPQDSSAMKAVRDSLSATLKDRQKYLGAATQFVGNFQKQTDLVEKYLTKGAADGTPIINKWIQSGRKAIAGDPDVTAFDTAIRGLGREHQRIVTGLTSNAQLHIAAAATADELLNRDMTPEQIKATLGVMREEAKNALDSGHDEVDFLTSQIRALGQGGSAQPAPAAQIPQGWTVKEH